MRRPNSPALMLLVLLGLVLTGQAWAESPRVVTTIKPVQALTLAVMQGVASPERLLPDGASPHAYTLRPSDMRRLSEADLLVWIGPGLETFLLHPLEGLPRTTRRLALLDTPGLLHWPARTGGAWEVLDDHGHDHAHRHEDATQTDPHAWLDPRNAARMGQRIAQTLAEIDPANAERYGANAARLAAELEALDGRLAERLAPARGVPYVVFHDAYQYFERRYGLSPVGAVSVTPGVTPGVRRVQEIRARIRESGARCVFAEPQFQPALVETLTRETDARAATLDPLGSAVPDGPQAYAQLMEGLADALLGCLNR